MQRFYGAYRFRWPLFVTVAGFGSVLIYAAVASAISTVSATTNYPWDETFVAFLIGSIAFVVGVRFLWAFELTIDETGMSLPSSIGAVFGLFPRRVDFQDVRRHVIGQVPTPRGGIATALLFETNSQGTAYACIGLLSHPEKALIAIVEILGNPINLGYCPKGLFLPPESMNVDANPVA